MPDQKGELVIQKRELDQDPRGQTSPEISRLSHDERQELVGGIVWEIFDEVHKSEGRKVYRSRRNIPDSLAKRVNYLGRNLRCHETAEWKPPI